MSADDRSRSYYDAFATHYEDGRDAGYHRWLDDRSAGLISEYGRGRDILEVGCGTGLILDRVTQFSKSTIGLDLSPGMLEVAKRRGLDVVEGSARALPFQDNSFDVIYSFKVLAHIPDLAQVFDEMARVVRPGGHLILEFYNRHSLRWWVRRVRPAGRIGQQRTEKDVYTRFHTLSELQSLIPETLQLKRLHGLRIATLVPQMFRLPVLGPHWEAMEDMLSASVFRRYAGFLVLVLERK